MYSFSGYLQIHSVCIPFSFINPNIVPSTARSVCIGNQTHLKFIVNFYLLLLNEIVRIALTKNCISISKPLTWDRGKIPEMNTISKQQKINKTKIAAVSKIVNSQFCCCNY